MASEYILVNPAYRGKRGGGGGGAILKHGLPYIFRISGHQGNIISMFIWPHP